MVLLFCEGVYIFVRGTASVGRYGGSSVLFGWIVGASGPLGPDGRNFPVYTIFHIKSVLSGTQKSSTGSNLRYTRCLDLQYPVRTGTPDPRFTRFTGFTWYRVRQNFANPKSEIYQ